MIKPEPEELTSGLAAQDSLWEAHPRRGDQKSQASFGGLLFIDTKYFGALNETFFGVSISRERGFINRACVVEPDPSVALSYGVYGPDAGLRRMPTIRALAWAGPWNDPAVVPERSGFRIAGEWCT